MESVGGGRQGGRGRHGHVIRLVGGGRGGCFPLSFFPVSPSDFFIGMVLVIRGFCAYGTVEPSRGLCYYIWRLCEGFF